MLAFLDHLFSHKEKENLSLVDSSTKKFVRYDSNPILTPSEKHDFMAKAVFSPTVVELEGKIYILYRAQSRESVSTIGLAISTDGFTIDENLKEPIYTPTQDFERGTKIDWNSGCEDPRITQLGDQLYMTYIAYDGTNPPRVALTSISVSDFLKRNWNWAMPKLISPPGIDDKDACIVKHHGDGYLGFHRLGNAMWLDFLRDLKFPEVKFLTGGIVAQARADSWDNVKIGIAGPPLETDHGWLLFYHAVSNPGFKYKIGAMILDYDNPRITLGRSDMPLLEPETDYELYGQVPNAVFSCGSVIRDGVVYLYYSGADSVICVATMPLANLLDTLLPS